LYYFLVLSESDEVAMSYGYPCPMGGTVDLGNDYQVMMTVTYVQCETEVLAKPHGFTETINDPPCPPGAYIDTYNSGCDAASPPGPVLALGFDSANGWIGRSGRWADPNDPNTFHKDYDWYSFTTTQNKRFQVYLYADFGATWEVWNASNCAYGPVVGLDVPPCTDAAYWMVRCYTPGTYWLRVYPTLTAQCGRYYYLALIRDPTSCSPCSMNMSGTIDLDDPCDDIGDVDTNYGCDDPNETPMYMTFNCGSTYHGRIYAGLQNGAPYYDADWFKLTNTFTTNRQFMLTYTAEFQVHLELYANCTDYANGEVFAEQFALVGSGTSCPGDVLQTQAQAPGTILYGRITCVDQLHNLLTKYYSCAHGWNRWKLRVQCNS
jgi:hypothetical protein